MNDTRHIILEKITVRIKENSLLAKIAARKLGTKQVAIVLGRTIHLYNTSATSFSANKSWLLHELMHVDQYGREGLWGFLWQYIIESLRHGYYNNRLEVEARNAEQNTALLEKYRIYAP